MHHYCNKYGAEFCLKNFNVPTPQRAYDLFDEARIDAYENFRTNTRQCRINWQRSYSVSVSRDERTKKAQWLNVRSLFLEKLRIKGTSENGWDPLSSREGWGKKSSRREILSRGPVSVVWIFSSWPKNGKEVGQITEALDAVEWCDKNDIDQGPVQGWWPGKVVPRGKNFPFFSHIHLIFTLLVLQAVRVCVF